MTVSETKYLVRCYFCEQEKPSTDPLASNCKQCAQENELDKVATFYTNWNGHRYAGYGFYTRINNKYVNTFTQIGPLNPSEVSSFITNTKIYLYDKDDKIIDTIKIPGAPLTLQNVKKKLSIYLTFS